MTDQNIDRPDYTDFGFDSFMRKVPVIEDTTTNIESNLSDPSPQLSDNEVNSMFGDDSIPGTAIKVGTILAKQINVGEQTFTQNMAYDTSIQDKISWGNGTITLGNTKTLNINSGSIGPLYQNTAELSSDANTVLLAHMNDTSGTSVTDSSTTANNGAAKSEYLYQRTITISGTFLPSSTTLTNFPFYLQLTNIANLKTVANGGHIQSSNAYDVFFTMSDGTKINHEVAYYDGTVGTLWVWLNLTTISNAGTTINMYYGKSDIGSTNYDNRYVLWKEYNGVYHFMNNAFDSSAHGYSGTVSNTSTVLGKIDNALSFNGTNANVSLPPPVGITNNGVFTVSAWIKPTTHDTTSRAIYSMGLGGTSNNINALKLIQSGGVYYIQHYFWSNDQYWNVGNLAGAWHHVAITYDGTNVTLYLDGINKGSLAQLSAPTVVSANVYIGWSNYTSSPEWWNGLIDEFKVSPNVRTQAQIQAEYNQQNNPTNFITLNAESSNTTALRNVQKRFGTYSRFFDAFEDQITFPYVSAYNISTSIQIEASFYPTQVEKYMGILSKGNAGAAQFNYYVRVGSREYSEKVNSIDFGYRGTDGNYHEWYTMNNVIQNNQWYDLKIQFTFGVPSSFKLYLNNILMPGGWRSGTGSALVTPANNPLYIGSIVGQYNFFSGWIDEVRVKNAIDTVAAPVPVPYYLYYNGTTTLQSSLNSSDAVGTNKKLLAIWYPKNVYGTSVISIISGSGTTVDGSSITTGIIKSYNGRTKFDLSNNQIYLSDGQNNRFFLDGNTGTAKGSKPGYDADITGNENLTFSTEFTQFPDDWTSILLSAKPAYLSSTTITIAGFTPSTKFSIGDRLRINQGSGIKYCYVVGITSTYITVVGDSSFAIANTSFTQFDWSKIDQPLGFTPLMSYNGTWSGVVTSGSSTSFFYINRNLCTIRATITGATTTSGGFAYLTLPVTSTNLTFVNNYYRPASVNTAGIVLANALLSDSTHLRVDAAFAATTSNGIISVEYTYPIT